MGMTLAEFAAYFANGILQLQSTPVAALYLGIVALSPLWIRNVRALEFRKVLVVYNFACSLVSLYAVALFVFGLVRNWPHSLFSRKENPVTTHAIWVYYMTKYVELLDTVFMILRHRQRQISFLHKEHRESLLQAWVVRKVDNAIHRINHYPVDTVVYHHPSILMVSEYAYTYGRWPAVSVTLCMNGIIHVFLYYYYGMCALNPGKRPAWKKQLTQLQLIQFMVGLCHLIVGYLHHGWCMYGIWYELTMIWLFSHFYYQAYIKERVSVKKLE